MANDNCLRGMQCPKCNSTEPFRIEIKVNVTVYDDGFDYSHASSSEWNKDSWCGCVECNHHGKVKEFRSEGSED